MLCRKEGGNQKGGSDRERHAGLLHQAGPVEGERVTEALAFIGTAFGVAAYILCILNSHSIRKRIEALEQAERLRKGQS